MLDLTNARAFNSSLKKAVTNLTGQKVKVEIINSYNFPRPTLWVRVHAEKGMKFSNEFKLQVFDVCGNDRKSLLDETNVSYGNIQSTYISAYLKDWCKLFN
jgi:hypothetical protein